jgi:hypothetical protein
VLGASDAAGRFGKVLEREACRGGRLLMMGRVTLITVLIVCVLGAAGAVDRSIAAPIPEYFEDEWVGFACLTATKPGASPTPMLLQLDFDKLAGGGLSQARADSLFARMTSALGWLSQLTGATLQVTCLHSPSEVQAMMPGVTGRQAALGLSGSFQQLGFTSYVLLDTFVSTAPPYLGFDALILRTDGFLVTGPNNLSYLGSNDIVDTP